MRDPKRIDKFCNDLAVIWKLQCPDWRFGQLMMNVLGAMRSTGRDPFFPEETEMIDFIRNYFTPQNKEEKKEEIKNADD